jgi:hypothetical protein
LRVVQRDARRVTADALAVAILLQCGINVAAEPPGTVADFVEAVIRAVGRPHELDGAVLLEAPTTPGC